MSNNNRNWEKDLKEKFSSHEEPTNAHDFDMFLDKLESNNFFRESKAKRFGKWTVGVGILIAGLTCWLLIDTESSVQQSKQPEVIATEVSEGVEEVAKPTDDSEKIIEVKIDEPIETKVLINEKELETLPLIVKDYDENNLLPDESSTDEIVDTLDTEPEVKQEPVVKPEKRKPIFIMSTDTTVVIDTNHVKHRRKQKRK